MAGSHEATRPLFLSDGPHRQMTMRLYCVALLTVFALGCANDSAQKPEPTRFTQVPVADGLDEPLQLEFDTRGHVYWIERGGAIKRIHEATGRTDVLGTLPLYKDKAPGLIGFLLDDDFAQTRELFVYYSAAEAGGNMRLSRFTLDADDAVDLDSEVVLLTIPWEQPDGSHFGGGMTWDRAGNLYLSVGGDTPASQYEPIHQLDGGRRLLNGARTAGNTNDLRGTILRITPQPNGGYTIPAGNLFSEGTPHTRPEIYVMGTRNPWRLSIDSQTGYLHWGEVGPDAGADSDTHGPMGYDEFNVARSAGNFGWPFVVGMNRPYHRYNYQTETYGAPYDPQSLINDAPNNTGLRELPPARPSLVAYPYRVSETWPILGSAARSAVGGPVFNRADFADDAPRVFPPYFEDTWLVTDYVRNWITVIRMNAERTAATAIERLVPADRLTHKQPLDMDFGPTGDLYVVEYGRGRQGRLSKIVYNDGNRPPRTQATANRTAGATPLQLRLSSEGTVDDDGDALHYTWIVEPSSGGSANRLTGAAPTVTLEQPGRYDVVLTVRDPEGAVDRDSLEIVAGNERPIVDIEITNGNRSFYFPDSTIAYNVQVQDHEDGRLGRTIPDDRVHLTAEYLPSGLSPSQLSELLATRGTVAPKTPLRHLQAQRVIAQTTCRTCHRTNVALVGPSFRAVAERYANEEDTAEALAHSITEGSSGTWGESTMPPQTTLSATEVDQVVDYILSLAHPDAELQPLPLRGTLTTEGHENRGGNARLQRFFSPEFELGAYVWRARYTDTGSDAADNLALRSDDYLLLRPPLLGPETADIFSEEGISYTPSSDDPGFIVSGPKAYIGFEQIDLTGIRRVRIGALTRFWHWSHFLGATVELRLGAPDGPLVGAPHRQFRPDSITAADGPFFGDALDPPVAVDVSAVRGLHDVYVVFRNPEAAANDALLVITGLEFEP